MGSIVERRIAEMKRVIAILLMLCVIFSLTACSSKPFKCDMCSQEKTGKKHTSDLLGEKITVCDDCYKEINSMFG